VSLLVVTELIWPKLDRGKIYVEYINCYYIYFFSFLLKVFKFLDFTFILTTKILIIF